MVEYQDKLNEFAKDIREVTKKYKYSLEAYELAYRLIAEAVLISLCCAPNELVGVKSIISNVENGIAEYEEMKLKKRIKSERNKNGLGNISR